MNEIFDRFISEHLPKLAERTQLDYSYIIRKSLRPKFGKRLADSITREEILKYLDVPKGRGQQYRRLTVLSSALGVAVYKWGWCRSNPVYEIRRRTPPPAVRRYVTDEELNRVLATASPPTRLAVRLAVLTGAKQGSILGLKWTDVDYQAKEVRIWNPQTKKHDVFPMTTELREVLADCKTRAGDSQYVVTNQFGSRYTSEGFRTMWQRMSKKVPGAKPITFHDLRYKRERDLTSGAIPAEVRALADAPRETPSCELKPWMQLSDKVVRAGVARHLAALSNNGGGYLIFGFTKDCKPDQPEPQDLGKYNSDEFAGIVDKYLTPAFHCDVFHVTPAGATSKCVVVRVPSHRDTPICAQADGPHVDGRAQGVQIGRYYIRVNGPKSEPIKSPEQWQPVIRRCIAHGRQELLESLLDRIQEELGTPVTVSVEAEPELRAETRSGRRKGA